MRGSVVPRHQGTARSVVAAAIFAAVTIAVAALGSIAVGRGRDWYDTLQKPGFTPAGVTFGVVWTLLYVAIGLAGWLAWRSSSTPAPTIWWAVQMALNLAWTVVFFALESPAGGVVVIAALVVAVAVDVQLSARADTAAGVLLFPYVVWCLFAAALNLGVVALN